MYDLLDLYAEPYDAKRPVVCLDEKPKQLLQDARTPIPAKPGRIAKVDYEYKRKGTANIFMAVEPKGGKRFTRVTEHRKKPDFASYVRDMVDQKYSDARVVRLVVDNLNTHNASSFHENLSKKEARRILNKLEFHYTPKHASWLNMAETEIGIMDAQCTGTRIEDKGLLAHEVRAWTGRRNRRRCKINWTFTKQKADEKLGKYYAE